LFSRAALLALGSHKSAGASCSFAHVCAFPILVTVLYHHGRTFFLHYQTRTPDDRLFESSSVPHIQSDSYIMRYCPHLNETGKEQEGPTTSSQAIKEPERVGCFT
jgi:hypothetical protein